MCDLCYNKSMKKYIKPKIKAVSLDPEQAVLAVCVNAGFGAWITTATTYCAYFQNSGGIGSCTSGPRNKTGSGFAATGSPNSAGS